ncbi:hypothetical protein AAFF_G00363890 [Aldrovandia affinis]|uniref:Uncharacterized protein n=1 Tax=Aldrovandia affinis TaxID=143900 RepID=A0AAD7WMV1_9TELE|nr:hypothetical protein AAFF_G00363890 [Aldrovandia affinis]
MQVVQLCGAVVITQPGCATGTQQICSQWTLRKAEPCAHLWSLGSMNVLLGSQLRASVRSRRAATGMQRAERRCPHEVPGVGHLAVTAGNESGWATERVGAGSMKTATKITNSLNQSTLAILLKLHMNAHQGDMVFEAATLVAPGPVFRHMLWVQKTEEHTGQMVCSVTMTLRPGLPWPDAGIRDFQADDKEWVT